jgi:hypothetical protein
MVPLTTCVEHFVSGFLRYRARRKKDKKKARRVARARVFKGNLDP